MGVRECVAINSNTPKETLKKLAEDEYWVARVYVAENPNADDEIREIVENTDKLYNYLK